MHSIEDKFGKDVITQLFIKVTMSILCTKEKAASSEFDFRNLQLSFCGIFNLLKRYQVIAYLIFSHSSCLNPTKTISSETNNGRFTNLPLLASNSICSSSVMLGSLSFRFISL